MAIIKTRVERVASINQAIGLALPKATLDHYGSAAHKAWRKDVLERAGFQCQAVSSNGIRCTSRGKLYADHVEEIADFPELALDPANGQALCARHHMQKTARMRQQRQSGAVAP